MGNGDAQTADVVKCPSGRLNTLVVSTKELTQYTYLTESFTNDIYGENMNQNFVTNVVQTTENVHNGEDNSYWTASIIVGAPSDFTFNSTDQAHTGTQSIDATASEDGDQFQLKNDSLINPTTYDRLVGWIYIDSGYGSGDAVEVYFYNTTTGVSVSNTLDISDYININNVGTWQEFIMPLSDFGFFSDDYDALRFTTIQSWWPPNYYLDDIALEELSAGSNNTYTISPTLPYWWFVDSFQITVADAYSPTLADSAIPKLPYNTLLGTSLSNGILYSRIQLEKTVYSTLLYGMLDFMEQPGTELVGYGSNGTNTWLTMRATFRNEPITLKSEFQDKLQFTINDDLSGLLRFKIIAEVRQVDTSKELV